MILTDIGSTFAVRMFLGLLLLVSVMVAYVVKRWLYLSKWDHIPGPKAISRLSFYNIVRLGHLGEIEIVQRLAKRRGCLLSYGQAEPGIELTPPRKRLLAEPCKCVMITCS